MYTLELAQESDASLCYEVIEAGRAFQKEQGFEQWTSSYPNFDTIVEDIQCQKGYVIKNDGDIIGYMCIDFPVSRPMTILKAPGDAIRPMPSSIAWPSAKRPEERGLPVSPLILLKDFV